MQANWLDTLFIREIEIRTELATLYNMLDIDFPAFARMPWFMLRSALRRKKIQAIFITDGTQIFGYAIYQTTPGLALRHILYIAVLPQFRSSGVGSQFLTLMEVVSPEGILLDVENPEQAKDEKAKRTKQRRIAFYEKNGFSLYPGFQFRNFGYSMLVMSNVPLPEQDWLKFYRQLYNQAYHLPFSSCFILPV